MQNNVREEIPIMMLSPDIQVAGVLLTTMFQHRITAPTGSNVTATRLIVHYTLREWVQPL